jgi:hypothetical protein
VYARVCERLRLNCVSKKSSQCGYYSNYNISILERQKSMARTIYSKSPKPEYYKAIFNGVTHFHARLFASARGRKNIRFCPRVRLRLGLPPAARRIFFSTCFFFSSPFINRVPNITQTNTYWEHGFTQINT